MKDALINARIESDLKQDVEQILKQLGLSATQAITMYYQQIRLNKGLPFEVKLPNEETQKVIEESRKGINVDDFSLEELQAK
jgi:DNA-damage-inducible protein J